jgi:hypothetical protein
MSQTKASGTIIAVFNLALGQMLDSEINPFHKAMPAHGKIKGKRTL